MKMQEKDSLGVRIKRGVEMNLDKVIGVCAGGVATVFTCLWGGLDEATNFLLYIMSADIISGFLAAKKRRTLSSEVAFVGGLKKIGIIMAVSFAYKADILFSTGGTFRTFMAWYFIANEAISFLENIGTIGVSLPHWITDYFVHMKDGLDKQDMKVEKYVKDKSEFYTEKE